MRQRLLRLSGMLAAVLLLQWAVGVAGCLASMVAPDGPDLLICHADGGAAPRAPYTPAPYTPAKDLAASICPLCVQLSAVVLPGPPGFPPGPPLIHAAAPLPDPLYGIVPARFSPARPARGPADLS